MYIASIQHLQFLDMGIFTRRAGTDRGGDTRVVLESW